MRTVSQGFTLIELIIVIVITGIIAGMVATFIARPMQGFAQAARRTTLTGEADGTLIHLRRNLRRALPNSIRTKVSGTVSAVEYVNIVEGIRYRTGPEGVADLNNLSFKAADTDFNTLGTFSNLNIGVQPASYRLVIYNTGMYGTDTDDPTVGSNVYAAAHPGAIPAAGSHIITTSGTTITLSNSGSEDHFNLSPAFLFYLESPQQRLYVVDTPVSYLCDTSDNTLRRYSSYTISSTQPVNPAVAPLSTATSALLANNIESCNFTYTAGTAERNAVLTIELVLNKSGERVRLLHQVHVVNTP